MVQGIEKRKNNRLGCFVPVEGKQGGVFDHIQTVDFSRGGLGLVSEIKVPIGKEIAVEIQLSADEDPVLAIGTVRWVSKGADNKYRLGMNFKEVLRGSKTRLMNFFRDKDAL